MPSSSHPSRSPLTAAPPRSPRSPALDFEEDPSTEPAPSVSPRIQVDDIPYEAEDEDDDIPYPEPTSEQTLLPPPNFNPFFTLIEDSTTSEHHHPYVHYVFADDDPVIVTAAAMRSLGLDDTQYLPQNTPEGEDGRDLAGDGDDKEPAVESPLPPPLPGAKERYLLVDLSADGHSIVDAQSLSPDWQITSSSIRPAPSFEGAMGDPGQHMLKVEGVEVPVKSKGKAKGDRGEGKLQEARDRNEGDVFGAMDGLISGIEGSLDVAGRIGGRREGFGVGESDGTVLGSTASEQKGKDKAVEE